MGNALSLESARKRESKLLQDSSMWVGMGEDAQLFLYIFGGENSNSCGITTLQCRRSFNSALVLARVSAREGRREGGGCCPINGDGETAATIYAKGEATSINGLFSYR